MSRKSGLFIVLLLVLILEALGKSGVDKDGFMRGVSGTVSDPTHAKEWLSELGATHCRRYFFWKHVQPELHQLDTSLTLAKLKANPKDLIYSWSSTLDWKGFDKEIKILSDVNVSAVVEVGEGTVFGLPKYNHTIADPGIIGTDLYLAYQYRFSRAVVHRYRDEVKLYQIENELNEAFLEGFYGARLKTAPWRDWDFLTQLLSTLRDAVKDEDPTAQVTMNFHTDVPEAIHSLLDFKGFYLDAVKDWAHLLDVVSYDAYPNMYISSPSLGHLVGARATLIAAAGNVSVNNVFVMETGYPVNADSNQNAPAAFNFSTGMQANYVTDTFNSLVNASALGLFVFELTQGTGMTPPKGGYTTKDSSMFEAIKSFLISDDVGPLIKWLLEPGDLGEILTRASIFMGMPDGEHGWGLIDEASGSPRGAFFALEKCFKNY